MGRAPGPADRVTIEAVMTEPRKDEKDGIVLNEAQKRARRSRSIAIAVALGALVILFYIMTLVKGPGVLVRPI